MSRNQIVFTSESVPPWARIAAGCRMAPKKGPKS